MAFVTSRTISATAGAVNPLPVGTDVSTNAPPIPLYSHMRIPTGPVSLTFDTGLALNFTEDTVLAIPAAARQFTSSGNITIHYGQMT